MGYDREAEIEGPGQFAVRGGIVDIFPLTEELPVRIEFWDDEIDSIRTFDVETQRSVENRAQITVYPAKDEADPGREVSFLRYFDPEQSLLFLDEPGRLRERGATVEEEVSSGREREEKRKKNFRKMKKIIHVFSVHEVTGLLNQYHSIGLQPWRESSKIF